MLITNTENMITSLLATLLGLVAVTVIINWLQKRTKRRKMLDRLPGPPCYPVLGNLPSMIGTSEHLWKFFRKLNTDYYPIYRLWNGHLGSVALLNPDDIEIVLSSKKHLRKTKIYEWLQPWLGTGLLTSAGSKWQHRRKILSPAFHFNILQDFVEIFIEQSEMLVLKLGEECDKPHTDLIPIITQFTLHSICETAMGTRLDETKKQAKQYVNAIYRMGELIFDRLTRPWLFFNKIYFLMPEYRERTKLLNILHSFSMSVIEERKINFKEPDVLKDDKDDKSKKRLAMLDLLISAKNNGVAISDEGIREEVDTFMFEGHDTTTASICFTLMLLANNQDVQEKVAQELQEVFENSNRPMVYQDLSQMRYLEQVIKESLRMYPSVPTIGRITDEEIHTATGYTLPSDIYVHVHIYDLHYNPRFYPNPFKFDPDRFSPENSQGRHPFTYLPFSAGSRNCIGQKFALLELKSVISSILRKFVVKPIDTPSDLNFIVHLVLKTQHSIKIKFEKRVPEI